MLVAPNQGDLQCLSQILQLFARASGLVSNFKKCVATPICYEESNMSAILQAFPCVIKLFPCRYLGVPLSLCRLRHADEQPLVDVVAARIPTWKARLLNNAGRLVLTKVTLSAIPVHISIACCLSDWAIKQIDRRRHVFLWSGTDSCSGGKCRVAWPSVCRPTDLGGLGILDLRFFGFALRLRWQWLSRVEPQRCWTTLPARTEKCVAAMCVASMSVVVGDGASTVLWTDNWVPVGPLHKFAPALYAAVSRAGRKRTLRDALSDNRWAHDITGATTTQVICEYLRVLADPSRGDVDAPAGRPICVEVVANWCVLGILDISSILRKFNEATRSARGLANQSAAEGEALFLACSTPTAVDVGAQEAARFAGRRCMCPLLAGTRGLVHAPGPTWPCRTCPGSG